MANSVLSILLILTALHLYQVSSDDFPNYVQNTQGDSEDTWNFHTKLNGMNFQIYFHGDIITAYGGGHQGIDGVLLMNFSVVHLSNETGEEIYYIETNENSTDAVFPDTLCLIFYQRTSHVVQISSGKAHVDTSGEIVEYNCTNPQLVEWPLVSNKVREWSANLCPIVGGFNVKKISSILHAAEEETYCDIQPIKALVESECSDYEGLQLTFADKTCIPKYTGWALEQQLTCLDTWELGDYQYAILGDNSDKIYHPQYCMKAPKNMANEDQIMIFLDMMCPSEDPVNYTSYITLNVSKKSAGLCENEPLENCTEVKHCGYPLYKATCRATCGYCGDIQNSQCTFDSTAITSGDWILTMDTDLYSQVELGMTIDDSSIKWKESSLSMTCSMKIESSLHDTFVMNVSTVDGCLPRYTCGKFLRASPSVLQYKLSKFEKDVATANELCSEDNFEDDPWPLRSIIRSQHYNVLISNDTALRSQTVPCNFMGNHTLNVTVSMSSGPLDCTGSMSDLDQCEPQNNMTVDVHCNSKNYVTDIDCMATMDFGSTAYNALITYTSREGAHRHVCWVIIPDTNPMEFYVMTSPQCDQDTLSDITTGDRVPGVHATAEKIEQCKAVTENPDHQTTLTEAEVTSPANVTDIPDATTSGRDLTSKPDNGTEGTSTVSTVTGTFQPKTTEQTPGGSSGPSAGEVIGILIGVIVGAVLIGALGWFVYRQYLARKQPYRVL